MANTASLKQYYKETIVPALIKQFGYTTVMQVPVLEKIVINQGLGMAVADKKIIETAINELTAITGQKAVATVSKKGVLTTNRAGVVEVEMISIQSVKEGKKKTTVETVVGKATITVLELSMADPKVTVYGEGSVLDVNDMLSFYDGQKDVYASNILSHLLGIQERFAIARNLRGQLRIAFPHNSCVLNSKWHGNDRVRFR